jgi:hypothetical protein
MKKDISIKPFRPKKNKLLKAMIGELHDIAKEIHTITESKKRKQVA